MIRSTIKDIVVSVIRNNLIRQYRFEYLNPDLVGLIMTSCSLIFLLPSFLYVVTYTIPS